MESQISRMIKILKTDNDLEFFNEILRQKKKKIVSYTP